MSTQSLSFPLDITWQRLGYSADMIDDDFRDVDLPPRWRPSMALYAYVVPDEQTVEAYPDHRIVYLRLVCTITGWNPDEEVRVLERVIEIDDLADDAQRSVFEAFEAGRLSTYAPCSSAIAQVAVYPHGTDDVGLDDFPFVLDFEPKKRELYETRSETGETLSGSSENVNVKKGTTTVESTEHENVHKGGFDFGFSYGGGKLGVSQSAVTTNRTGTDTTTVDMHTTDTSREKRETTAFSTTFNQMYQLFNGYHSGSNRALFFMQARPHTVSPTPGDPDDPHQIEFNLVNGERRLEGLQDMFLVVQVPRSLGGMCVRATLDTGHTIDVYEFGGSGRWEGRRLVVTRRSIANCGRFSDDGGLVPTGVPPGPISLPDRSWIVDEAEVFAPAAVTDAAAGEPRNGSSGRAGRVRDADDFNTAQRRARAVMLRGASSRRYRRRRFEETDTFGRMVHATQRGVGTPLGKLHEQGTISDEEVRTLRSAGAVTVADLYRADVEERVRRTGPELLTDVRSRLVDAIRDRLRAARRELYT